MVKRKDRVGILAYDLGELRGGTKLALVLGNLLKSAGYDVAYSCVYERIKEAEKFFGEKYDFKVYKAKNIFIGKKLMHYTTFWNHAQATNRLIKDFKPDVVIEIGGIVTSLVPAIKKGIPTIYYCTIPVSRYADTSSHGASLLSKFHLKFFRFFENYVVKRINVLVTMCNFTEKLVKPMWDKENVTINPPTDISMFKPKKGNKKKKIILSVCRYDSAYKLYDLVNTFRKISKIDKDYELHLTAQLSDENKAYYKKLKSSIKEGEKIFLHKDISFGKLLDLYNKASFFWYTAFTHFGLIFVEAQAAEIPVLAFKYSGGAEEIIADKKSGYLVKDFSELYEKTKKLIENKKLWRKMSKAAGENSKRFGYNEFKKKFSKVIEQVLAQTRSLQ